MFFYLSYIIIFTSVVDGINNVVNTESSQSPLEVTVFLENVRLLHVDELPSTMSLALSLCVYWSETRLPNKPVQQHIPELNFDKVIDERRFSEKLDKFPDGRRRLCYSAVVEILCPNFDMSDYPADTHHCDLLLMAKANASNIILLPHLHIGENYTLGNTEWSMQHTKTFVQWVTIEYEDFEVAVLSFVITRNSFLLNLIQWNAFLLNVLIIFMAFPANSFANMKDTANTHQLLGPLCQIIFWTAVAYCTPPATSHPLIVRRFSYFVALSIIVSLTGYFAPFMALSLRCVPYHAHPCPIDFPTPNELLSLDSERARYSSVLDSARHDSSPSQRTVNADLCMAQVRYTLSAVNEFLSITASAKWHRRQWMQGFARIQMLLLIFFQALNLILFLIFSSN